jgi:hypothetical protein
MKPQSKPDGKDSRSPMILLVDPRSSADRQILSEWLASHSFSCYEAIDAFDAIGQIADFTTDFIPEIVTIPRSGTEDVAMVSDLLHGFITADIDLPIFLYSQERNARAKSISTEELGRWLQRRRGRGEN